MTWKLDYIGFKMGIRRSTALESKLEEELRSQGQERESELLGRRGSNLEKKVQKKDEEEIQWVRQFLPHLMIKTSFEEGYWEKFKQNTN